MPYAEIIAKSFPVSDKAAGVLSIDDIIQEANISLVQAVDRIDFSIMNPDDSYEKQIKGFIKKRIKGAIRRAIDNKRGDMRIPEHKLNEIRSSDDAEKVRLFFNSIFVSIEEKRKIHGKFDIVDTNKKYKIHELNKHLLELMDVHLTEKEYEVLRMSFGLDCDKMQAKDIAKALGIKGSADYVRVSQIKRDAINKLIEEVQIEEVIEYL